jgi:hypothetical protein
MSILFRSNYKKARVSNGQRHSGNCFSEANVGRVHINIYDKHRFNTWSKHRSPALIRLSDAYFWNVIRNAFKLITERKNVTRINHEPVMQRQDIKGKTWIIRNEKTVTHIGINQLKYRRKVSLYIYNKHR